MYIETLIYIYIYLCISLIIFNILWLIGISFDTFNYRKNRIELEKNIKSQLYKIKNGLKIEKKHNKYLIKKLKRIKPLNLFHEVILTYEESDKEDIDKYLLEIRPVFIYLTIKFKNKNTMKKAYLAYVISSHKIFEGMKMDSIVEVLISYMYEDSIYCRENVMRVLYSFGDAKTIIRGIKLLEKQNVFYHTKLLTDGLLSFKGDHNVLYKELLEKFDRFKVPTRIAIINYFRMGIDHICEDFYPLLSDDKVDDEIKYSIIRYYGDKKLSIVKDTLIKFLEDKSRDKWQYAALSALALKAYYDKEVEELLKRALSSENWYVRLNSAKTLVAMGFESANQVLKGDDGFASQILQYNIEYNYLKSYGQSLVEVTAE